MLRIKRLAYYLISVFICSLLQTAPFAVKAQSTPPINNPSILPPSPEATALQKFGDIPVGMFTGTLNYNLDVYKMATKHLSLPISLSYSSGGLKVDEVSSKVGMTWVLNCGGMISRTVYGKPDFDGYTAPGPPPDTNFEFAATDSLLLGWMKTLANGNGDFQMDAFNYNFNGYTGKFFISPLTGLPIIAPFTNIAIQYSFSQTNWNFKVTTPDGTIYYFGGTGATEYTEDFSICTGNGYKGEIPTAWCLTKIQYPTDPSDSIVFSYSGMSYEYPTGVNESVWYLDHVSQLNVSVCAAGGPQGYTQPCPAPACNGPTPFIYGNPTTTNGVAVPQYCQSISGVSGVCLEQITDARYNLIKFNYIAKPDVPGDSLVAGMTVYNNQTGKKIRSFNFLYTQATPNGSYTTPIPNYGTLSSSLPRPFLTEMDELDSSGTLIAPYKFGYTDFTNLAPRLSFAQDYWGYFNGITQSTGIPLPAIGFNMIASNLIANRNPDYTKAGLGLLNKVTYPTGGYTAVTYEGNTMDSTYTIASQTQVGYPAGNQTIDVNSSSPTSQTFSVDDTVTVTITETLSCPAGGCPVESNTAYWGELVHNNKDTLQATYQKYNMRQEEVETVVTMTLPPGVYGLDVLPVSGYSMDLNVAVAGLTDTLFITNLSVSFPLTESLALTGGGMRVQRVVSYDPVATDSTVKHYYYDQIIFPAQPVFYNHFVYTSDYETGGSCVITPGGTLKAGYNQFYSSSLTNLYGAGNSLVYYPQVRESFGDNFANGGIQHSYSAGGIIPVQYVWGAPIPNIVAPNLNWQNGLETSSSTFKMVNGTQVPVQTKTMTYLIDPRNSDTLNQYTVQSAGSSVQSVLGVLAQLYNVAEVSYITQWQYLNSQITQSYDLDGNPTVADTLNYFYDNPAHAMLTRVQGKDSKGEPTLETKRYPQDSASFAILTSAELPALTSMVTQGRIGEVIEDENDKNSLLVRRIHNTYSTFTNGLTLMQGVQQQNGAGTSYTDYTVNNYDPLGSIRQMTPIDGVTQNYIWDYRSSLPIALVTNGDSTDIAYTSFEADGTGGWTLGAGTTDTTKGITGNKSFIPGGGISKSGLNSAITYVVSYWTTGSSPVTIPGTLSGFPIKGKSIAINGNTWSYYEYKVTGESTISFSGSANIDELRLYPATAQMVTYAYLPLFGMISQCDADNRVTYYEYDGFQRLKDIKDQDGNVIKTFKYHYQGQNN